MSLIDEGFVIPCIHLYDQEIIDGALVLTLKKNYVSSSMLLKNNIINSNIVYCKLNNENLQHLSYHCILNEIYKDMPVNKILQNTTLNFKLNKLNGEDGYYWYEDIKMSMQEETNYNKILHEIMLMIKLNNYQFEIGIKLKNNNVVYCKVE